MSVYVIGGGHERQAASGGLVRERPCTYPVGVSRDVSRSP